MCGIIGINSNKPVSVSIINSLKWEHVKLKDGDNLEIVSIVGGG